MTTILPGPVNGAQLNDITLGVMGGGQLARMFVHSAQQMGYRTAVLDPDTGSPAGSVSHVHVQTGYSDADGLAQLAACSAAITTEFENVPADALAELARTRPVAPSAAAVRVAQDRRLEKAHFVACGVPVAPYAVIENAEHLAHVPSALLPGILKTARMGYDGKGQVRVQDAAALGAAWQHLGGVPCVLEQLLPLEMECSVVMARASNGHCVHFEPQRNVHRDGILAETHAYAGCLPTPLASQAVTAALAVAHGLDYVGVLCVEFFVLGSANQGMQQQRLVVNEIAPRPHNSGHYTMDACDLSQFDLQVRTMACLPLVPPRHHSAAVMLNLLGELWPVPQAVTAGCGGAVDAAGSACPPWGQVMALPGVHVHLYGKEQARPGRKMGHLTVTGRSAEQVLDVANQAARLLGLPAL